MREEGKKGFPSPVKFLTYLIQFPAGSGDSRPTQMKNFLVCDFLVPLRGSEDPWSTRDLWGRT